jgi:transcriptional regulator with XRE-family HTH domain
MASRSRRKPLPFSLRTLGTTIRDRRLELELSQEELGKICKLDRTYISGVENGRRNPTMSCVDGIARSLGLTLADLVLLAQPNRAD